MPFFPAMFGRDARARRHEQQQEQQQQRPQQNSRQTVGSIPIPFFNPSAFSASLDPGLQAAMHRSMQEESSKAPPPASRRAIRQLPTILVRSEDLVEESNRECCICFEEHKLGDKVTRLPCAHIYHPRCIADWLSRSCTCPVCRYELPTDDPDYEKGRLERMSSRKPRYAKYELQRMSPRDLGKLCARLRLNTNGTVEKSEIIHRILDSGKIDVIVAPKPLEYESLAYLRSMGVGKLKKAMTDAGVFFDAKDVVEKEDMVQIFLNSGRIQLNDTEEDTDSTALGEGYNNSTWKDVGRTSYLHEDLCCSPPQTQLKRARMGCELMEDEKENGSQSLIGEQTTKSNHNDEISVPDISSRSIKELLQLAKECRIDLSDCIEKKEMVDKIVVHLSSGGRSFPRPSTS
mmetsp:Transcript_9685/g.13699  ORF Transcript_9685/g.13699 Transcript_9685/m.13699 type:complete len:403 (-) Transcript_9685:72-1280(-)